MPFLKRQVIILASLLILAGCGYLPASSGPATGGQDQAAWHDTGAHAFDPRDVPGDIARQVARELEQARSPRLAKARILKATRLGFLYPDEGKTAQQLMDWYGGQRLYARADYLAQVLGTHWTIQETNRFWIDISGRMLQQDAFEDAERALQMLREPMTQEIQERRESLLGLVLLLQSQGTAAVAALERRQGFPNIRRADHFNFAVAMVEHDRKLEGLSLLDELAEMPGRNETEHAIRDRANMVLGWVWLEAGQGGTSRATFKRVRLDGPYSNLALLGLGWAELVPDGEVQRIQFKRNFGCEDIRNAPEGTLLLLSRSYRACGSRNKNANFMYYRRFAFEPGGSRAKRYNKALLWLSELAKRDASVPAVQEALLAVGYVLAQQGDIDDAIKAYQLATMRYEAEIVRLSRLAADIRAHPGDIATQLASNQHPGQFKALRSSRAYANLVSELSSLRKAKTLLVETGSWLEAQAPQSERRRLLVSDIKDEWRRQSSVTAVRIHEYQQSLAGLVQPEIGKSLERLRQYRSDALLATARLYDEKHLP